MGLNPRALVGVEWPHWWAHVASRADHYRACQRTTNAFFPGPPRTDPGSGA